MIPFNKPYTTGKEVTYIQEAIDYGHLSGDGIFTKKCNEWLEKSIGVHKALLTHCCTAALEMAAILADISDGDEIIMPSFTFVSTANAFVLRGGVPVFVDIRPDTLNIDETKIEESITPKTKAIVVVHYAGVACEMDTILEIARRYGLVVVEDAAHCLLATYRGKTLGSFGQLSTLSFHETKNIIAGEGGALLINSPNFVERAEIIREKGTNRSRFFRGQVDKYTWVDIGSSYLPSEINAAFLWGQMEETEKITQDRLCTWEQYHEFFAALEAQGLVKRPSVPVHCKHNAHMYYLLLPNIEVRTEVIQRLKADGIMTVFHYVPLHHSPAGLKYGRAAQQLFLTEDISERIMRLPLWVGLSKDQIDYICERTYKHILDTKR